MLVMSTRLHPRRAGIVAIAPFIAVMAVAAPAARRPLAAQEIPSRLSDTTFWRLVTQMSEAGGTFRSDNFVSNEDTYQWVIPDLLRTTRPAGVYLGVGPDQNFTYLVALRPKIAFIFDIRRQNMLTHLMYKALIEQSPTRAEFLARLFSRPTLQGVDTSSTAAALFTALAATARDSVAYYRNLAAIDTRLIKQHGFTLSDADTATIDYVYDAFYEAGPDLTYNFGQARGGFGYGRNRMPTYGELQVATDSAGLDRSYLATEANYRALRDMEMNNLVVPLVGDFAGPKAIRAVGDYLRANHATVTAFYLSNVEQYLFQQDDEWRRFYASVGTLPLDSTSTFIRSVFNGMRYYGRGGSFRGTQLLASMMDQVKAYNEGRLVSYEDVIRTSR
jgi:hypothetical protein